MSAVSTEANSFIRRQLVAVPGPGVCNFSTASGVLIPIAPHTMTSTPAPSSKKLYQIAFVASLVFLGVALLVVHPRSRFGFSLTCLALVASIGSGLAFRKEKERAATEHTERKV
jgi:hypothetical protein